MKMEEYVIQKTAKLKEMKLSELLQEASEPLLQDTGKKFQYVVGSVLDKAREKAVEMETAVATDDKPLKERSIANRIKSFKYGILYKSYDSKNLFIDNKFNYEDASFLQKLYFKFPKAEVKMMDSEEREKEILRIARMMEKIQKANNLPKIEFDTHDVCYSSFGADKPRNIFNAYAHHGRVVICPLNTKYCSDNELARVLSHEMGHIVAGHSIPATDSKRLPYETILWYALKRNDENNGIYREEVNQTLLNGLRRYQEYEADILGASFMKKAGYDFFNENKSIDKVKHFFRYDDKVHSSPAEQYIYIKNYDYSKLNFSLSKRYEELRNLTSYVRDRNKNPLEIEKYFMRKVMKFTNIDNQLLENRIREIEQGNLIDKMKALPYLLQYKQLKVQEKIDSKSSVLGKIYETNENEKNKRLREVGQRIQQSLTRADFAKFYLHQAMESPKMDIVTSAYMSMIKTGYNTVKKGYNKIIDNKKQADLGR